MADSRQPTADSAVRLDRWLWAARFYKTRAAASQAIDGGKVDVNDARAKRAKLVHVGDRVRVRRSPFEYLLTVRMVSEHRGPARVAATLYEEDPAGKVRRERLAQQLRVAPVPAYDGKGRPTKRDRREMERLRGEDF
jgi:ribosome-associated heat shock protein Hsp15